MFSVNWDFWYGWLKIEIFNKLCNNFTLVGFGSFSGRFKPGYCFWPRVAKHRGPRSVIVVVVIQILVTHCSKFSFFVQKFTKIVIFFGWKTCEKVVVLDFLAVDNFDFTRKIVKIFYGEILVKMLGFCQNWVFGQKFDFSKSESQIIAKIAYNLSVVIRRSWL